MPGGRPRKDGTPAQPRPKVAPKTEETPEQRQERARAILEQRRMDDPIRSYVPGIMQGNCLYSMKMVRMIQGGSRSGKTAHMCVEFAMAARRIHPTRRTDKPVILVLWANSREQIRDVLYQKLRVRSELKGKNFDKPMIPDYEVVKDHMVSGAGKPVCREIELKNGNRIMFAISGLAHSWESIQGKGYIAGIGVDEQAGTQELVDECMSRLMELNNPEQIAEFGGAWFMWSSSETMVNEAWDSLKSICLDDGRNKDAGFFCIPPDENIAVSMEARNRVGQFMSEEGRTIRVTGEGRAVDGILIYHRQWNRRRHVLPEVWNEDENDNIWMLYDPGWKHGYGLAFGIISQNNPLQIRMVQGFSEKKRTLDHIANQAAMWLNGRKVEGVVYDPSAHKTEHSRGKSNLRLLQDIFEPMGFQSHRGWLAGRNRYEDTIPAVQRYLDPYPDKPDAEPLLVFDPPSETNGMGLVIHQMVSYRLRTKATNADRGDSVYKLNDEFPDMIRYLVSRQPSYSQRGPNRAKSYRLSYGPSGPPRSRQPDEMPITPDMDPGLVTHIQRLRESSRRMSTLHVGNGMPVLSSTTWNAF